jgi:hypothetical protein
MLNCSAHNKVVCCFNALHPQSDWYPALAGLPRVCTKHSWQAGPKDLVHRRYMHCAPKVC